MQIVLLKDWHMSKDEMTRRAIASSNIVINLIGSSLETRNFSFEDIHTDWPKKLAQMVAENPKTGGFVDSWPVGFVICELWGLVTEGSGSTSAQTLDLR
jgi:hypothetical protein